MSQFGKSPKTFTAGEALEYGRRVKLAAGPTVVYADAGEGAIGVTAAVAASGALVPVILSNSDQTVKVCAADSFAAIAVLYAAADGKVSDSVNGSPIGTALAAASGDGSIVEMVFDNGVAGSIGPAAVLNDAANEGAIPVVFYAQVSNVTGGAKTTTIATTTRKLKVIGWHLVSRDTQAANIKLQNASSDLTANVAKGTANDAIVQGGTIVAAQATISSGAALKVVQSADSVVDVCVIAIPVA